MKPTISDLQPLFYKALGKKADITESTIKKDMPLWDSVNHINLIIELEEYYKISFTTAEIKKIDSVKSLLEIMDTKTAQ